MPGSVSRGPRGPLDLYLRLGVGDLWAKQVSRLVPACQTAETG